MGPDSLTVLPPGGKGTRHAGERTHGEFYIEGNDIHKAPVVTVRPGVGKCMSIGFRVCRASPYVSVADLARCLTLGEAAEDLIAFATASELIDTLGPTLEAASQIGDGALAAYAEGGKDGLLSWVRQLRGTGLAKARGLG